MNPLRTTGVHNMNDRIVKAFTAVLYVSAAAAILLAFAWPFLVSPDRDSPAYKVAAVGALLVFFASLMVICALRLRATHRDPTGG